MLSIYKYIIEIECFRKVTILSFKAKLQKIHSPPSPLSPNSSSNSHHWRPNSSSCWGSMSLLNVTLRKLKKYAPGSPKLSKETNASPTNSKLLNSLALPSMLFTTNKIKRSKVIPLTYSGNTVKIS